jgi:molybdopterin synthase sulfur carrier subunit
VRDLAGAKSLAVPFDDGCTARELIQAIDRANPQIAAQLLDEEGGLSNLIHIYVRGRNIEYLQGLDTVIEAGDDVLLVPPMAGG